MFNNLVRKIKNRYWEWNNRCKPDHQRDYFHWSFKLDIKEILSMQETDRKRYKPCPVCQKIECRWAILKKPKKKKKFL